MRKCPVCNIELKVTSLHGEEVDRCSQCNGIYFDKGELESVIHLVKLFKNIKLNEEDIYTITEEEESRELKCPVDNKVMDKKDIAGLIVDICPECEGIWLDNGEISALKLAENHIKQNLSLYLRLGE